MDPTFENGAEIAPPSIVKTPEVAKDIPKIEVRIEDRNIESFGSVDIARATSEAVAKRIEEDGIEEKLKQFENFVKPFKNQKVEDGLRVSLVHGMPGDGEVFDGVLSVNIQSKAEMEGIDAKMATGEKMSDKEETNNFFEVLKGAGLTYTEATMDQVSSTTMHELEHEIINSRPDSELRKRFEEVTDIENDEGNYTMSFLDEGIVYAFQFLKDSTNENFNKIMEENSKRSEEKKLKFKKDPQVAMREELGRKLQPKVEEYIGRGGSIDDAFLKFAGEKMKEIGIEKYILEMQREREKRNNL